MTKPRINRRFRTPVRGHAFAARLPATEPAAPGAEVSLVREHDNPADPLAVAVWLDAGGWPWRIGYLDRGVAARLAPRMDRGQRFAARLDGWLDEPAARWRRPALWVWTPSEAGPEARPPGVRRRRVH